MWLLKTILLFCLLMCDGFELELLCTNGNKLTDASLICDKRSDCEDSSDEEHCQNYGYFDGAYDIYFNGRVSKNHKYLT